MIKPNPVGTQNPQDLHMNIHTHTGELHIVSKQIYAGIDQLDRHRQTYK